MRLTSTFLGDVNVFALLTFSRCTLWLLFAGLKRGGEVAPGFRRSMTPIDLLGKAVAVLGIESSRSRGVKDATATALGLALAILVPGVHVGHEVGEKHEIGPLVGQ